MIKYPEYVNLKDRIVVGEGRDRRGKVCVTCPDCGEGRYADLRSINIAIKKNTFTGRCQICSSRLMGKKLGKRRGIKSSGWKGGKHYDRGYVVCSIQPDNPFFCMTKTYNQIYEHRLVVAEHLGRPLTSKEVVHHIDGERSNNHIDNLVLMTRAGHDRFEWLLRFGEVKREDAVCFGRA